MPFLPLHDDNPTTITPFVTYAVIGLCIVVFAWQMSLLPSDAEAAVYAFGAIPAVLLGDVRLAPGVAAVPSWATLVTSMFLHGGWLHVLGNLWTLGIFGDNVEDRMGKLRFLVFYLVCGVLAGAVHVYFNPGSAVPTIGASGAISGVMGAYFVMYPRARVITLIPLLFYPLFVELPAFVFLGVWFSAQLLSGTAALSAAEEAGGIAFLAHVGGFVAGVLLHWLFLRPQRVRGA
jgi:membrane associated rhomboid family serine protease